MNNQLLFVCGFPSSGTDLVKNILNSHPQVYINGEFPLLPFLTTEHVTNLGADALEVLIANLKELDIYSNFGSPDVAFPSGEYSLSEIYSHMLNDKPVRWKGNKTPQNTENIHKLKAIFPEAKFLVIIRDVRDVTLSWRKKWGKNEFLCASKWDVRMRKGYRSLQDLNSDEYMVIKYEDVLTDLGAITSKICNFLSIDYDKRMLEFHKYVQDDRIGKLNYGKEIIGDNKRKWQSQTPRAKVLRIEEIAYEGLQLFQYPITAATKSRPITRFEKYLGTSHDIAATVLVGNRAIKKNRASHIVRTIFLEMRKLVNRRKSKG